MKQNLQNKILVLFHKSSYKVIVMMEIISLGFYAQQCFNIFLICIQKQFFNMIRKLNLFQDLFCVN